MFVESVETSVEKAPLEPAVERRVGLVKYFEAHEGYYATGDAGMIDKDGFLHVMTRVDDVINVAGHRLSTGAIEEVVSAHPAVAESAVLGKADELKGEVPVACVIFKEGFDANREQVVKEIAQSVRERIGAISSLHKLVFVQSLPKTKSGKILRNVMRSLVNNKIPKIPPTVEDLSAVEEIEKAVKEHFSH